MAGKKTKPLSPKILQEDLDAYAALKAMGDYAPIKPEFDLAHGKTAKDAMTAAEETAAQKRAEAEAARDDEVASQWAFHDYILGARTQVIAQYGDDSNQKQAVGLKKKSEYKSPSKKKPTP